MKGKLLVSMLVACLPWLAMAQSNDDLYFIPKKQKKEVKKEKVGVVPKSVMTETVNDLPAGTTFVVKDVKGNVRDVDEYNRRYTSKENTFSYQNDTLMVTEKPFGERGEWVDGFEGSEMDYEYAMRLVRFKNPRYMIPVSSPMYWEVVNGTFCSWDWNVYDDGLYAYVFPSYTNRLWWDWRFSPGFYGPHFSLSIGWHDPWFSPWYGAWHSPWYGGYWGGYWGSYWGGYWGGYYDGYWGHRHGWGNSYYGPKYHYNDRRGELYGRSHRNSHISGGNRGNYVPSQNIRQIGDRRGRTGGRVVRSSDAVDRSSRVVGSRSRGGVYSRPTQSTDRSNRVYTRPSSTRRNSSSERYNSGSSRRRDSFNYSSGSSSRRSNSSGSFRSGGGSTRQSGGGSVGRSGGGVRRR